MTPVLCANCANSLIWEVSNDFARSLRRVEVCTNKPSPNSLDISIRGKNILEKEKIFHYTSIESLALILHYKSLRFTRLDRVDDVHEAQTHYGIPFGKYLFVSCWTQQEVDNIAQWKMYGADMAGVRIELPVYPFRDLNLTDMPGLKLYGDRTSPLNNNDLFGRGHFVSPPLKSGMGFAGPVEYVDDVANHYAKAISSKIEVDGKFDINILGLPRLARLKSKDWEFQAEYRFLLNIMPISPAISDSDPLAPPTIEQLASLGRNVKDGKDPHIFYYDVPLDPKIFDKLTVRIGPLCSDGGRKCVDALVATFAPGARVEESPLRGSIRSKVR